MKRRININIIMLLLFCSLLLSSAICFVLYDVTHKQEIAAIKDRAALVADLLNYGINDLSDYDNSKENYILTDFITDDRDTARITIISPDGNVLLDNKTYAETLENHSDREEFRQAMETGYGEATRFSTTFNSKAYYYAVRLNDGNIIRISKTVNSIFGIFSAALPAVIGFTCFILLLANVIARRLTRNIINPINNMDLDNPDLPIYDELAPFVKKIEQQRYEINKQILSLEDRAGTIKAITENMKEGLILVDKNGIILSANISAVKIFDQSDMDDKNILLICRDIDLLQKIRLCLSGENLEMTFERNGKIYNTYLNPVHHGEEINGAVILFLDTTEKYKTEKQRREFSANVSHELKTPLTTIYALSEMIETGMAKEEDINNFAAKISEQSKRLIDIIDDIIRLSEFDEGSLRREYTSFDLYGLAENVCAGLRERADKKQVIIKLEGEHFQMTANMRMIDELLYNLIDNGIKYNKDGGKVTVSLSATDGFHKISVTDTGIGIPREHLDRVFERFYRVDKSRSKKTGGTGLGLSIVKHIAEHHMGRVEIESSEGVGTAVVCFIGCVG